MTVACNEINQAQRNRFLFARTPNIGMVNSAGTLVKYGIFLATVAVTLDPGWRMRHFAQYIAVSPRNRRVNTENPDIGDIQ